MRLIELDKMTSDSFYRLDHADARGVPCAVEWERLKRCVWPAFDEIEGYEWVISVHRRKLSDAK